MKHHLTRAGRAFGHFWWDFLVGDTPEFAVAVLAIVGLAYLLRDDRLAATLALPLVTTAALVASTLRGRRRGPEPPAATPTDDQDSRDVSGP